MNFAGVVEILDKAVGGPESEVGPPHRAFWRGTTRDKFIELKIRALGQDLPLVKLGDGANSNLVLALNGQAPFGKDQGVPGAKIRRMPAGLDAVPADSICEIEQWINDDCPEGTPAAEATGRATDT